MWALLIATALADDCTWVGMKDIVGVPAPAVIVLGERHGHQPDLARAASVVKTLSRKGPVTVALEAVDRASQPTLDRYAQHRLDEGDLSVELQWEEHWGFDYGAYAPLVTACGWGARVLGIGQPMGPKPDDETVPLPPRYIDLLRPAMGGHEVPLGAEQRFVLAMAWRDHALARAAIEGWDGKGHLVIVVGRGSVEGGKGVGWQAQQLTEAPVRGFVLKAGDAPACHPGDALWR